MKKIVLVSIVLLFGNIVFGQSTKIRVIEDLGDSALIEKTAKKPENNQAQNTAVSQKKEQKKPVCADCGNPLTPSFSHYFCNRGSYTCASATACGSPYCTIPGHSRPNNTYRRPWWW